MTLDTAPNRTGTPQWYRDAIATRPEMGEVLVDGVPIATRTWGRRGDSGIVLVHGGAAHSGWWDHIGPLLAATHRVVALDLSGHGDSGRHDRYSLDLWATEVLTVATLDSAGPATIVGHSLGGLVALRAAAIAGRELSGLIVVDTAVRNVSPEAIAASEKVTFGPTRIYPTRDELVSRFRVVPPQSTLPYIEAHIAEDSVTENGPGWSWKFDPKVFDRSLISRDVLARLDCRVAFFRGERGLIDTAMERVIYDGLGRVAPLIEIPQAGHHVMLDQPLALVTGIRTLLGDWDHSLPMG